MVTNKRCLEMISEFEYQLSILHKTEVRYNEKEKSDLIKLIKNNPNDLWEVCFDGIYHFSIDHFVGSCIKNIL